MASFCEPPMERATPTETLPISRNHLHHRGITRAPRGAGLHFSCSFAPSLLLPPRLRERARCVLVTRAINSAQRELGRKERAEEEEEGEGGRERQMCHVRPRVRWTCFLTYIHTYIHARAYLNRGSM